jgi:oxepin-CoA hydrolase/3-oxo-5,6-dehydrosuberyl-CoA semialdehyde dehydrogenase
MNLQSYVGGAWQSGRGDGVAMRDATTGEVISEASSTGVDFAGVLTMPARWAAPLCAH